MTVCKPNRKREEIELVSRDSYYTVYGFMRSDMHLEKTELLVFALIYGYFRNCSPFTGSRKYISEWVGSGFSAVKDAIDSLVKKGYISIIKRRERGINITEYAVNIEALPQCAQHSNMIKIYNEDKRKARIM